LPARRAGRVADAHRLIAVGRLIARWPQWGPSISTAMIASRLLGTQLFAMDRVELFFVTVAVIGFALLGAALLWM
jgi:hypothetical protein